MKNLCKNLIATLIALMACSFPAFAGTVTLQADSPLYTVNEGVTLTDEEQRFMDCICSFFYANPTAESLTLTPEDFPSISCEWVDVNLFKNKIKWITMVYPINPDDSYGNPKGYLTNNPVWAACQTYDYDGSIASVEIRNGCFQELMKIDGFLDHTYSLLPAIGIQNGMSEREAIDILNSWECSYLSQKESSWQRFLTIYEHQGGLCSDYSYLFKALCNGAGIEAYVIHDAPDCHAWNEVVIDGTPLEIDVFWNDLSGSKYIYLLSRAECGNIIYHSEITSRS